MKRKFLLSTVAMIAAAAPAFAQNYKLVWSDEFNGSALDEKVWNIEVNGNGGGNNELQYYARENVTIEKEPTSGERCLTLTARREDKNGKNFTSGRLNSQGKVYFKHGKIESRIMMPKTANGLWPAFWMMGNDIFSGNGWPKCGEIDIVEMGNSQGINSGTQEKFFNGACHWGFYKDGAYPNYARSSTNSYSIQDGQFHLFTLTWDENVLRMYLDQDKYPDVKPYYEIGLEVTDDDWSTGKYFHKDFFILYDLAIGGNFTGIWDAAKITALPDAGSERKMYIDWVRVYQEEGKENITYPGGSVTPVEPVATIPAAPTPSLAESDVVSLFSDKYSNNHNFNYAVWWDQQAWQENVQLSGNNAWHIKNFNFIGSEHDQLDVSGMDGLHMDIYPVGKDFSFNVSPINKSENEQFLTATAKANRWNRINLPIADYKAKGLSMTTAFQIKMTRVSDDLPTDQEFYLDNVYYYKGIPDAIKSVTVAAGNAAAPMYNLAGQRVGKNYKGIVIVNGKKILR